MWRAAREGVGVRACTHLTLRSMHACAYMLQLRIEFMIMITYVGIDIRIRIRIYIYPDRDRDRYFDIAR